MFEVTAGFRPRRAPNTPLPDKPEESWRKPAPSAPWARDKGDLNLGILGAAPVNAGGMAEEAPEAAGFLGCLERSDRAWTGLLANPAAP